MDVERLRACVRPFITGTFGAVWLLLTAFLCLNPVAISIYYVLLTTLTWGLVVWCYGDRSYFKRHQNPLEIINNFDALVGKRTGK